jgi:hypothetical protein
VKKQPALTDVLAALGEVRSFLEEQAASLQDGLDHAVEVMRENTEEVGVLRDAIDELREHYRWTLNNPRPEASPPFHLTSMPIDPTADDWSARLNGVTRTVFDAYESGASTPVEPRVPQAEPEAEPFQLRERTETTRQQQRLF